jgi:hypothetical protein
MPLTKIQSLGITDGTIVNADINASAAIAGTKLTGVGKVLQVVQTVKTDTFSTTSSTFTDVTGLSVSITPSSASNKILVLAQISYGGQSDLYGYAKLIRGSTSIFEGDSDSASRVEATVGLNTTAPAGNENAKQRIATINYLDSPATTSATTYKIQVGNYDSFSLTINKSYSDTDFAYIVRSTSSITVMEIAG